MIGAGEATTVSEVLMDNLIAAVLADVIEGREFSLAAARDHEGFRAGIKPEPGTDGRKIRHESGVDPNFRPKQFLFPPHLLDACIASRINIQMDARDAAEALIKEVISAPLATWVRLKELRTFLEYKGPEPLHSSTLLLGL